MVMNMKNLKGFMFWGAIIVCVVGTLLHFAYGWSGKNAFVGIFTPINESTWEHMKLIFFPMCFYYLMGAKKHRCIVPSMAFGILLGTWLIPILFYTYSGILGFNFAIADIAIFFISVIMAFFVSCKFSCKMEKHKILLNSMLIIMSVLFMIFTFYSPDIALFVSP